MMTSEQTDKLWDMIKDIKVGMLTTLDDETLHARPMHIVQDGMERSLYFFTKKNKGKVEEVQNDGHVCVTFAEPKNDTYVSLSGIAYEDRDQEKIEQFWNPFVAAYFPKGQDDPETTLLRIDLYQAEYWDADESSMVQLFKFAKANLTDTIPNMGDHRKYA